MQNNSTSTASESPPAAHKVLLGTIANNVSPPPSADAIIQRFYIQSLARELLPQERVSKCLRAIIPGAASVDVIYDPKRQRAQYKNLITCGRLWFCSVCAARITEQRAQELQQGVVTWTQESGFVALLTFTLRHSQGDELLTVLDALRNAHRAFKQGAPWQRFKERYGWHGSVTALEVTHADHGWHPHLHELVFFQPLSAEKWREFPELAKQRWIESLRKQGRDATWANGLDVRDADSDVYEYVAKYGHQPVQQRWTIERELAKSPTKKAGRDGSSPWQLLMDYGGGDASAGKLFQEYARVFKGRKQLTWSVGLRAELELGAEAADEQLAAALPDEYTILVELKPLQWRHLMVLAADVRGELLAVAAAGDRAELLTWLYQHGVWAE